MMLFIRVFASFILLGLAWVSSGKPGGISARAADPANSVIAEVGGEKIYRADLEEARSMLPLQYQQMSLDIIYPALLEQVVDGKLIEQAARHDHLEEDAEVKRHLARAQGRILQQVYLSRRIESQMTDEKLRSYYEKLSKESSQEEIHARHILVSTEDEAREIIGKLEKGADFAQLAREKSTGPETASGGDLGYFTRDEMLPEFAEAAFALKPGEFAHAPVKTKLGWHVILVEDRRSPVAGTFEESQSQLRSSLSQQILQDVVDGLRAEARIVRYNLDGSAMSEPEKKK